MPLAALVVGSVAQLDASPQPGYVWGYWTGTDGDTGSGDHNMATTVTSQIASGRGDGRSFRGRRHRVGPCAR